jgi:hypothetical protein
VSSADLNPVATLGVYRFPGNAGELQRSGARASLVRELADNYNAYHDDIAAAFDQTGAPDWIDFDDDDEFLGAWTHALSCVRAEAFLRLCLERVGKLEPGAGRKQPLVLEGRLARLK